MIIDKSTKLIVEKEALSGVKRVMGKLAGDFELVFGEKPLVNELDTDEV